MHKFQAIIGYDNIPSNAQKPSAVGGILCLNQIFKHIDDKIILYIGDHEGDVQFARNIESDLNNNTKILSVAANYSSAEIHSWKHQPDYIIETPQDLLLIPEIEF